MTIAAGLPTGAEDAEWRAIWRAVLAAGFELDQRHDVQGIYHRQVGLYRDLLAAGADAGVFTLTVPAFADVSEAAKNNVPSTSPVLPRRASSERRSRVNQPSDVVPEASAASSSCRIKYPLRVVPLGQYTGHG